MACYYNVLKKHARSAMKRFRWYTKPSGTLTYSVFGRFASHKNVNELLLYTQTLLKNIFFNISGLLFIHPIYFQLSEISAMPLKGAASLTKRSKN